MLIGSWVEEGFDQAQRFIISSDEAGNRVKGGHVYRFGKH